MWQLEIQVILKIKITYGHLWYSHYVFIINSFI